MKRITAMGYQSKSSKEMTWEFISAQLRRTPVKTALVIVVAISFMLVMNFINMTIGKNEQAVDKLYKMAEIDAELESADSMVMRDSDYIRKATVNDLLNSGVYENVNVQLDQPQTLWIGDEKVLDSLIMRGILKTQPLPLQWKATTFSYARGWSASSFAVGRDTQSDPLPIFLNEMILSETNLGLGDIVLLTREGVTLEETMLSDATPALTAIIAGSYKMQERVARMSDFKATVFFPFSSVDYFEDSLGYSAAEFVINPNYNRTINELVERANIIARSNHGNTTLRLFVWDEEIRSLVEPMKQTLSLLAILYPITTTVAVGVSVVIAYLLVMQNITNVAILRILGMDKRRTLLLLVIEQFVPCIIGLIIGLITCLISLIDEHTGNFLSSLSRAILYLVGCVVGSMLAGIFAVTCKPLYLLQERE